MKKKILLSMAVASLITVACKKEVVVTPASNSVEETTVNKNNQTVNNNLRELPQSILTVINKYYNQNNVASYEIKNVPVIGKSYEVKFNDGAEVDFDENGNWLEWKDPKGLPGDILPENIKSYLKQNYSNTFATSVDKEKNKISIDLASGIDLDFDSQGNFLRIDK